MEDDVFEKIEAYVSGEMNSEESLQFETEMSLNKPLATRVQLYKDLEQTLKLSQSNKENERGLQQTLSQVHSEYSKKPRKVVPLNTGRKWYAAAAAIFIIAVSVFLFQTSQPLSREKLYAHYAVFPALSGTRGNSDTLLSNAIRFYNGNRFAQADPLLEKLLALDSADVEMQLAFYVCELQTGKFEKAIKGFAKVASTENVFTYQAKWYMALTYLKMGNISECKKTLSGIPASADTYTKAKGLLEELK